MNLSSTIAKKAAGSHHIAGIADLAGSLDHIVADAIDLKQQATDGFLPQLLAGKAVVLLFEKNSTRTRISFEVGIQRLGGIVSTLDAGTSQIARGESLVDTGNVLGRYADAIVYRAKDHQSLVELAENASVPVVNALTDMEHPCQVLADWMALTEHHGDLKGLTFAYVGDGNNMCHSYLLAAPLAGMDIKVACPEGYGPDPTILAQARASAAAHGTRIMVTTDPQKAVLAADAVATDTWINMGEEGEEDERLEAFQGYTVDHDLMAHAKPGAVFMHCLPGHWGLEATEDVAHGPSSLIYEQAEARMWVQMALLVHLLHS